MALQRVTTVAAKVARVFGPLLALQLGVCQYGEHLAKEPLVSNPLNSRSR